MSNVQGLGIMSHSHCYQNWNLTKYPLPRLDADFSMKQTIPGQVRIVRYISLVCSSRYF